MAKKPTPPAASDIQIPMSIADLPPYKSPTLGAINPEARPKPSVVCEGCPLSLWFASPTGLQNYCRVMHTITWGAEEKNELTLCDGEQMGQMQRLAEAQKRARKALAAQQGDELGDEDE